MSKVISNSVGVKLFLSLVMIFSVLSSFNSVDASELKDSSDGMVYFEKINDSVMKLNIENGKGHVDSDGNATIVDNETGIVADLPRVTEDVNGSPVDLVYKEDGNNLLVEYHSVMQPRGFWECSLGTVGGVGTGALAGMGIGAIAVTPVTVLGGGVFGGAFGGMSGAANHCF